MFLTQISLLLLLVLVHLFAGALRFLGGIPRSRWLSTAGGISVAYVFMHILPELADAQRHIAAGSSALPWLERHAYLIALLGLAVFYGLDRMVKIAAGSASSRRGRQSDSSRDEDSETPTGMGVFWLHIGAFALYNALIGYLLVHREEADLHGLLFFAGAMALHFLVNDFGLRQDHRRTYARLGRWLLAGMIIVGWGIGLATTIHQAALGALFAFLAGGVILNVLKEELPEERQSRFLPFALGAAFYTALLLFF